MGIGWFLGQLVWELLKWVRERRSRDWPIAPGVVHTSRSSGTEAEVWYSYIANGESYADEHTRRFWFRDSAKLYTELFAPKTKVNIRYRADRPEKSVLRSQDQGKRGTQLDWL